MIQPRTNTPNTHGMTGRALVDPEPLISEAQAKADREAFMQTAANFKTENRLRATQRLRRCVGRLVDDEGLNCKEAAQRMDVSHSYAHRLYQEWKATQ